MNREQQNLFLIRAALDAQPWDSVDAVPTTERYAKALSGAAPLSESEKRQLWHSPTARSRFFEARQERLDAIAAQWAATGIACEGQRRAADSRDAATATVQTADYVLTLQRDDSDPDSPEWLIVLTLKSRLRTAVELAGTAVHVVDTGGMTWLTGTPDVTGVVSGFWSQDGNPVDRLRSVAVRVVPA